MISHIPRGKVSFLVPGWERRSGKGGICAWGHGSPFIPGESVSGSCGQQAQKQLRSSNRVGEAAAGMIAGAGEKCC